MPLPLRTDEQAAGRRPRAGYSRRSWNRRRCRGLPGRRMRCSLPASTVTIKLIGADAVSGIDVDGFDVSLAKFNPQTNAWHPPLVQMDLPLPNGRSIGIAHFANLTPGLYRANENGG